MPDPNNNEVCVLPNGCMLYRIPNEAGGYTYYSDEVGAGVLVWDTALVCESTLLAALVEEARRQKEEQHAKKQ